MGTSENQAAIGYLVERTLQAYAGRYHRQHLWESTMQPQAEIVHPEGKTKCVLPFQALLSLYGVDPLDPFADLAFLSASQTSFRLQKMSV